MICICHRWEIGHPSHRALLKTFTLVPTQKPFSLLFLLVRYFFFWSIPLFAGPRLSLLFSPPSLTKMMRTTQTWTSSVFFFISFYILFLSEFCILYRRYTYIPCACVLFCVFSLSFYRVSPCFSAWTLSGQKIGKENQLNKKEKHTKKKQTFIRERNTNMVSSSGFLFYFVSILPRVWSLVTSPSLSLSSFWWYDFYCWFCTIFQMFFPSHSPT